MKFIIKAAAALSAVVSADKCGTVTQIAYRDEQCTDKIENGEVK